MDDNRDSFLRLFLKSQGSLHGFAVSRGIPPDSAGDVVQEVAIVLWEKFSTFAEGTDFKAWAFAIARNEVKRFRRKSRRTSRVLSLDAHTLESLEKLETQDHEGLADYKASSLARCVDRLGDDSRRLVELRYGDGHAFKRIAKILRTTSRALRVRVCRIRHWLRECVTREMHNGVA
jgi:RNA polymerase sigma-70 factor (ECF subfamily)